MKKTQRHKTHISVPSQVDGVRNPEYWKLWDRRRPSASLRQRGMTNADWANLFLHQNGKCALCGEWLQLGRAMAIHIDHDHKTQKVRGLLCARCNIGLGFAENIPRGLVDSYLERASK